MCAQQRKKGWLWEVLHLCVPPPVSEKHTCHYWPERGEHSLRHDDGTERFGSAWRVHPELVRGGPHDGEVHRERERLVHAAERQPVC